MADRAQKGTGELQAGTRGLAALLGMSRTTVTAALPRTGGRGHRRGDRARARHKADALALVTAVLIWYANRLRTRCGKPAAALLKWYAERWSSGTQIVAASQQRAARGPGEERNQDQVLNQGADAVANCDESALAEHLRDAVAPSEIPDRVAALPRASRGVAGRWAVVLTLRRGPALRPCRRVAAVSEGEIGVACGLCYGPVYFVTCPHQWAIASECLDCHAIYPIPNRCEECALAALETPS